MTDLELMKWYQEWWKKQFPDFLLCELDKNANGEIVLRVDRPNWKKRKNTYKTLKDARYAYNNLHKEDFVKEHVLNLKVKLPLNKRPYDEKLKFRTLSTCVPVDFHAKVIAVCKKHNLRPSQLIAKLLEQVVFEDTK